MKQIVFLFALALGFVPLVAGAQGYPNGGPSPEMRAKMEAARGDAKTASYNALSADHRAKVQAIVDKFNSGTTTDPRDAASQIDAVLTPDEAKAVLAQRQTLRDAMHAAFAQSGRPAGSGTQGAPSGGAAGASGGRGGDEAKEHAEHAGQSDAGRFLLGVSADPEKLHAAMRAERERSQQ